MTTDMQPQAEAPLFRRLWFIVLLTCLLVTFPVAMILLLTGDVYRWRDGGFHPIKASSRYVYGGLLALWLTALVLRAAISGEAETKKAPVAEDGAGDVHVAQGLNNDEEKPVADPQTERSAGEAVSVSGMPADEEEFLSQNQRLYDLSQAVKPGTRDGDDISGQQDALVNSLKGRHVRNWTCKLQYRLSSDMPTEPCTPGEYSGSPLFITADSGVLTTPFYDGDVILFSGVGDAPDGMAGNLVIHASSITLLKKGPN